MSSYLNFYYVPKKGKKTPLNFLSVSRSSELYSYFHDNMYIECNWNEEKFTKLTMVDVKNIINDLNESIKKSKARLTEYEKYAGNNPDYIEEILNTKEWLEQLESVLHEVYFIETLLDDISTNSCNPFKEIVLNIG